MILLTGIILALIFLLLSLLHFYWAFGGQWGLANSVPSNENGKRLLKPGMTDCIIVALGLLAMSFFTLIKISVVHTGLPGWLMKYGLWAVSLIFLIRAIGDFRYVGFFKKVKQTTFARLDSNYYSPLCLFIAACGVAIEWMGKNG